MAKEYYIKEKEVKNNLNECLNDLSDKGLDNIIKNIDSPNTLKTRNKKIEYLNRKIPEVFTNSLNSDLDFSVYRMFNSKDNKINDYMVKHGFMFHYHMKDKDCINVIPIEMKLPGSRPRLFKRTIDSLRERGIFLCDALYIYM